MDHRPGNLGGLRGAIAGGPAITPQADTTPTRARGGRTRREAFHQVLIDAKLPDCPNPDLLSKAIGQSVLNLMNMHQQYTDQRVVRYCKIRQFLYLLRNETYRENIFSALQRNDEMLLSQLLDMDEYNVYSTDWKSQTDRLMSNTISTCVPNTDYVCSRCNERQVYSETKQIRSNDEGATNFFKCCNCGNFWRED